MKVQAFYYQLISTEYFPALNNLAIPDNFGELIIFLKNIKLFVFLNAQVFLECAEY